MIALHLNKKLAASQGAMNLDIKLTIQQGQFIALHGPSGAGKTTILRMLAGLLKPDKGTIKVQSNTWLDTQHKINIPPQQRELGFVFQEYTLFPNMTVRKNIEFALKKGQNSNMVNELISITELDSLQHQQPKNLSGGQKQRVALARALVQKPKILLLDEPLSALDLNKRNTLQYYIKKLHNDYQLTTILVSHDPTEIIKMADIVYCIDSGTIRSYGDPKEIFSTISTKKSLQLVGEVIHMQSKDNLNEVDILIGDNVVRLVATDQQYSTMTLGKKITLNSSNFNPNIS